MSDRLNIRFAADMPIAAVDIVAPDLQVVDRVMLTPGRSKGVDVPSEGSFLRVHMPTGQVVTLHDPGNLNREISLQTIMDGGRRDSRPRSTPPVAIDLPEEATFEAIHRYARQRPQFPPIGDLHGDTLPLASFAKARLSRVTGAPVGGVSTSRSREAHWQLDGPSFQEPFDFQIQRLNSSTRLHVRLPGHIKDVWVRSDLVREQRGLQFSIRLSSTQPTADTILGYLQRGDLYSAEAMAEWCDQAERMLLSKMSDPYSAAVGGYLLLRLKRFDQMRNWARNLANRFPFMSDGSVIWATQLIRQEAPNQPEIEEHLLKAAAAGPPIYAEGMSLLTEGLRLMGEKGRDALRLLLGAHDVLVPSSPLTAFIRTDETYSRSTELPSIFFDIAFAPSNE